MRKGKWVTYVFAMSIAPALGFAQGSAGGQGVMNTAPAASFSQLDTDANGMLDAKEYAEFQDPNYQFDFASADANKDGNLTREEWQAGMRAKVAPEGAKGESK
jgi:hypothetical protein